MPRRELADEAVFALQAGVAAWIFHDSQVTSEVKGAPVS